MSTERIKRVKINYYPAMPDVKSTEEIPVKNEDKVDLDRSIAQKIEQNARARALWDNYLKSSGSILR